MNERSEFVNRPSLKAPSWSRLDGCDAVGRATPSFFEPSVISLGEGRGQSSAGGRCVCPQQHAGRSRGHFHCQLKDFSGLAAGPPRSALPDVSFRLQGSSSGKYRSTDSRPERSLAMGHLSLPCAGRAVHGSPPPSALWWAKDLPQFDIQSPTVVQIQWRVGGFMATSFQCFCQPSTFSKSLPSYHSISAGEDDIRTNEMQLQLRRTRGGGPLRSRA